MAEVKSKYVTGFCNMRLCEGTKPKSASGKPMKTCPRLVGTVECTCECHATLDKMFELTGLERVIQENPEYHPEKPTYWMPTLEERALSFRASGNITPVVVESPAPDIVPPTIARPFVPTASGRAARGELEANVKAVCDAWLIDAEGNICTPAYISTEIGRAQGINPPSQGAVNAVFERWVSLGFAVIDRKPTRFTRYTEDGVKFGLEVLKMRAKQMKSSLSAAQRRGEKR